jgi:plexin A
MPFSVSLNRQQNSQQDVEFWYYNDPNLQKLVPDFAPLGGGATITLRGNNFLPFDLQNDINNANDTYCLFGALGKKPAKVVSSTEARCLSPPNNFNPPLVSVLVNLTLNDQQGTQGLEFIFFNPTGLSEVTPLRGPVTGGTDVQIYGTKFNHARDPVCIFGGITVTAKFMGPTHLSCIAPPFYKAGETTLTIKYRKDRFHAGIKIFTYYEVPTVDSIDPICGPMRGYTQIYVTGTNFLENNGFGKAQCKFNETYFTNATIVDTNTLWCDSPPLDLGDSDSGDYFYNFSVSADGEAFSIPNVTFLYYDDPDIKQIQPPNGPMNEANYVTIIGKSLTHPNMCNKKVRFGQ